MSKSGFLSDLFKAEAPRLRKRLARISSVSAEDVVQESFARLCAVDHEAIAAPSAYLRQTASNLARSEIRHQRALSMIPVADPDELGLRAPGPSPEQSLERRQEEQILRANVAALPDHLREPLLLAKVEGLSAKEIARRLGVTERTVYRHIAEAIARLHLAHSAKRSGKQ